MILVDSWDYFLSTAHYLSLEYERNITDSERGEVGDSSVAYFKRKGDSESLATSYIPTQTDVQPFYVTPSTELTSSMYHITLL